MSARFVFQRMFWKTRFWRAFVFSSQTLARGALFFLLTTPALMGVEFLQPLPQPLRRNLWALFALASLAASFYKSRAWRGWTNRHMAEILGQGQRPADKYLTAWDLIENPPPPEAESHELMGLAVGEALDSLKGARPGRLLAPAGFWAGVRLFCAGGMIALAVFTVLPAPARAAFLRVWWPFGAESVPGLAAVEPGNARFPLGESVVLKVRLTGAASSDPELWVRRPFSPWERRTLEASGPGGFRSVFENLKESVFYRVRYRGHFTESYTLTPIAPPSLLTWTVTVKPPPYTGRAEERLRQALQIRPPKGSRVEAAGRLAGEVCALTARFEDGRIVPVNARGPRDIALAFDALAEGTLVLTAQSPELPGRPFVLLTLIVNVVNDEPPRIQILSPAQDLLVGPRDRVPLVYEVSDDCGAAEVDLRCSINGGPVGSVLWNSFSPASPGPGLFEKNIETEAWGLKDGDVARYFLVARDNNALGGPGEGQSAVYELRVASYEEEHRALERGLEAFQKELLEALGSETLVRDEVGGEDIDWNKAREGQSAAGAGTARAAGQLKGLLSKMDHDPLTDRAMAAEYRAMAERLKDLLTEVFPRAEASLGQRHKDAARAYVEESTAELERFSLLAEEALKNARLRRFLSSQDELTQRARELQEDMAARGDSPLSARDRETLSGLLNEMGRLLRDMAEQMGRGPQALPDDFVNQEGVKNIRLDEIQSLLQQMQRALSQGDAAGALALAATLLDKLRDIQKVLRAAGQKSGGGPDWYGGPLLKEMEERQKELDRLVERQEELKEGMRVLSESLREKRLEWGRKTLGLLLARVEALRAESVRTRKGLRPSETEPATAVVSRCLRLESLLESVLVEMRAGRLEKSPELLREGASTLQGLEDDLDRPRAAAPPGAPKEETLRREEWRQRAGVMRAECLAIAESLRQQPPDGEFLPEDRRAGLIPAAEEQTGLRRETLSLRTRLMDLARKTALVGGGSLRGLQNAARAMEEAARSIEGARLVPAVDEQETALRWLRDAREELGGAAQGMAGMGAGAASPVTGSIQPMSTARGEQGVRAAPVRIPRVDEYRPPRLFREELLKSMREKYPQKYEKIIRDYYKNWAK